MKKGSKMTEESRKKISESKLRNPTRYWLGKERLHMSGDKHPMWKGGIGNCLQCGKKNNLFKSAYCSSKCFGLTLTGKPAPMRGRKRLDIIGELNPSWRGGVTPEHEKVRKSSEYTRWRIAVFERDNYTCQMCGARNGNGKTVYLEADHIKPFALYPELRLNLDNGRTLCKPCHRLTETWGYGTRKINKLGVTI